MLSSPMIIAKVESAFFIRSRLGVSGGARSERLCGSREINFAKTWFAIEACPGMILSIPTPPEWEIGGYEIMRDRVQTFHGVENCATFSIRELRSQLLRVFFWADFVTLTLKRHINIVGSMMISGLTNMNKKNRLPDRSIEFWSQWYPLSEYEL